MAKVVPFKNLVQMFKDKLGVDVADELQKAYEADLEAMREGIATKSLLDDSKVTAVATDVAEIKTTLAGVMATLTALTPSIQESFKSLKLEPATISMPSEYEKFATDTTAALSAVQMALKEVLEKVVAIPVQQKSEPIFQGISQNKATEALLAAISATNQKADAATKTLFPNSTLTF